MTMSTSTIAISLPFAGALAWTTVLLVGASGYRRADRWVGAARLARARRVRVDAGGRRPHEPRARDRDGVRSSRTSWRAPRPTSARGARASAAAARVALFVVVLPVAALAILVPHVDFLGESSLRAGYGALGDAGQTEVGDPLGSEGVWAAWPLGFAAAPGAYAGAAALACALLAARARRLRPLVVGVGGLALAAYVLTSPLLVGAGWFRRLVLAIPFGDVYLHNPGRLRYVLVLALPILAAAGLQGLLERPLSHRAAVGWLAGAGFAFVGWPLLAGGEPGAVRDGGRRPGRGRPRPLRSGDAPLGMGDRVGARRRGGGRAARERPVRADLRGRDDLHRASRPAITPRSCRRCCGTPTSTRPPTSRSRRSWRTSGRSPVASRPGLRPPRSSRRGTSGCRRPTTGPRSPPRAARCSGSPTPSATTPCSSPATGATSGRRTTCRSSTTRRS